MAKEPELIKAAACSFDPASSCGTGQSLGLDKVGVVNVRCKAVRAVTPAREGTSPPPTFPGLEMRI
jgi:hypothetical protein